MIIAHFFLREVKKHPYLFVETTSSQGIEQPSPAARMLTAVSYRERRQTWVKKAYYEFTKLFPRLTLIDAMENSLRLESDHPSFDLVFKPAEPVSAVDELTKGERQSSAKLDNSVISVIKNMFAKSKQEERIINV